MAIRSATSAGSDIDAIIHHRRATYREVGFTDERALDTVGADYRVWVGPKLESGEYLGWFALAPDSSIAAGLVAARHGRAGRHLPLRSHAPRGWDGKSAERRAGRLGPGARYADRAAGACASTARIHSRPAARHF